MRAEQHTDPVAYHAEGPCWAEAWPRGESGLRWVDMLAGDVLSLRPDGSIERRHVGDVAAVVRPRVGGGAVIGVERGIALEDADGGLDTLPQLWSSSAVRMNEGGCDPQGRFYCGSMAYDQAKGAARLYRLDADGEIEVVLDGVTISNGIDWSPDGSLAYYDDTETGEVAVFDHDPERGLTGRRVLVDVGDDAPDGLTVAGDGSIWVALAAGGAVHGYSPDGTLQEVVEVDATKVTACTFGGSALDRLYITTSQEDVDLAEDPLAGSLFVCEPGITGQPTRPYAG